MKKFMKKWIVVLCIVVLGLCACNDSGTGTKESEKASKGGASAITLKKDGSIECRLVEVFDADDSEDLKELIDTSISEFQSQSASSKISLKSCQKDKEGRLTVEMTFNDSAAFAGWNNYIIDYIYVDYMKASGMEIGTDSIENSTDGFFAGTVSDAYTAGYGLEYTLTAASESNSRQSVEKSDLLAMGESHIVILKRYDDDEPMTVNCYNEILYVGDGVTVTGKKSAMVDAMDGYGIIVFQ